MDIVITHNLKKYFGSGVGQVKALDGIDLTIQKGSFTAIVGASGSGKTTLLHTIGGLYTPTEGSVHVDGIDLAALTEEELTVFRRRKIGFIFQSRNLIPELNVRENILFPLAMDDARPDDAFLSEVIGLLGLKPMLKRFPSSLSGGQQQCVTIARALAAKPSLILADEPTGSLDRKSSRDVAALLKTVMDTYRQTLIMITHDGELAQIADRTVLLKDGQLA